MFNASKTLTKKYPEVYFVYPTHLNPSVCKPVLAIFGEEAVIRTSACDRNIFFYEPGISTLSFLMEQGSLVLTDSVGIQEEAPGLGKPVLVMRDTTERPEDFNVIQPLMYNYKLVVLSK